MVAEAVRRIRLGALDKVVLARDLVADLELPDLERTLGDTAVDIQRRAGFEARTHRLDFFGLCAACS